MLKYAKSLPPSHPLSRLQHVIQHGDIPWQLVIVAASALVMALVLAIGWTLWNESFLARVHNSLDFLLPTTDPRWDPVGDIYQAWPFIYGTLVTSLAALVLAIPISLGIAVFLAELCPVWLRTPLNWLVNCWLPSPVLCMVCGACLSLYRSWLCRWAPSWATAWAISLVSDRLRPIAAQRRSASRRRPWSWHHASSNAAAAWWP